MRSFKNTIATMLLMPLLLVFVVRCVKDVTFDRDCGGHLKRAADANTIELARQELAVSVSYLENHGMTSGYTSILYTTPDEDVGFWYKNLKASLDELNSLSPDCSHLEKSNMLLKLRQTLLDHQGGTESITHPNGISVYPNNTGYMMWHLFGALALLISVIIYIEANA